MDRPMTLYRRLLAALAMVIFPGAAALAQVVGAPKPWEIDMQPGYSPVKLEVIWLHNLVLVIITVITLLVAGLIGWVIYRYNAKRHPVPGRLSHHTWLEITWTVLPILILVVIGIPSLKLVYFEDRTKDADLTVKVTGHQWYWEYTYPDKGHLDFSSYLIPDDQLKPGQPRLLTVDNELVVPVGKNIRILTTSSDVIHSFFIPSLGVQRYAIPGRTIETWFRADKPGVYYGECNQICGTNHSRMPIMVRAVSDQEFATWLDQAKTKFSDATTPAAPAGTTGPRQFAATTEVQH
jgi:cytochrome c oxidase subunit 2